MLKRTRLSSSRNCATILTVQNVYNADVEPHNKREQYIDKNRMKKVASHLVKEKISVPALNAIDTIETEIVAFLYHQGIVAHQFRAIRDLKKMLGIDDAVIYCDFSENYAVAEEIQSVHFA